MGGVNLIMKDVFIAHLLEQDYLMEAFWRMVICLLIDGQEGKIEGRGVPPKCQMERVKPCHLKGKIWKLGGQMLRVI